MALRVFNRKKGAATIAPAVANAAQTLPTERYQPAPAEQLGTDQLARLAQQHRYAVVLADEERWASHPDADKLCHQAERCLEEDLALVPAGSAALTMALNDEPGAPEVEVQVEPFLLSVYPVTNARFQQFVDAGSYDDLALWPEETWPHLIELHDLTGKPGPRYWRSGRHDQRLANYPVVGISWYEASAYARWVGLRLPTEAEWQMAASWRIRSEADVFRRFPWGDAMDYQRCNIWGAGRGALAPVDAFRGGAAPNGVQQLIGNVWEWMSSDFELSGPGGQTIVGEMPMKCIRGGAYDTYFDTQANSTFRTGQIILARAHNVGFRCALDV